MAIIEVEPIKPSIGGIVHVRRSDLCDKAVVARCQEALEERAEAAAAAPPAQPGPCRPAALLVAPTRELAAQLQKELSWLYQPIGVRVAAVVGGTSYGGELRSLRTGPLVIVGTPGRLLDHLEARAAQAAPAA